MPRRIPVIFPLRQLHASDSSTHQTAPRNGVERACVLRSVGEGTSVRGLLGSRYVVLSAAVRFHYLFTALVSLTVTFGCSSHKSVQAPTSSNAKSHSEGKDPGAAKGAGSSRKVASNNSAQAKALPGECKVEGDYCYPPANFVERLCQRSLPEVAVYMMQNNQPWSRRYVRVQEAQAVNPFNGHVGEEKMLFGEEVIVLRYRRQEARGGMQVSGTERYEVLRWDGSCATLAEGELVQKVPKPQWRFVAPVWKRLGDSYRGILREHSAITEAESKKAEDCKGVGLGRPPKCYRAIEGLNRAVADAVRDGVDLPLPDELP